MMANLQFGCGWATSDEQSGRQVENSLMNQVGGRPMHVRKRLRCALED